MTLTDTVAELIADQLTDPDQSHDLAGLVLGTVAAHGRLLPAAIGDPDSALIELTEPPVVYDQMCAGGC